jgi:hypothetical protein
MYGQLLILIENRTEAIARRLAGQMQEREEVRHYREVSSRVREERIGNVIRDMCGRLGHWLNRESPKSSLAAHYSRLGAQRCKEGIPLDEAVLMILYIKRAIWEELKHKLVVDNSFTLGHLRELEDNYHLFLDRVIQSIITGYQAEFARKPGNGKTGTSPAGARAACKNGGKGKPTASRTAKEGRK